MIIRRCLFCNAEVERLQGPDEEPRVTVCPSCGSVGFIPFVLERCTSCGRDYENGPGDTCPQCRQAYRQARDSGRSMRPSYQRLLSLNPLLVTKSPEAVQRLIDVMEQHGMEWDESMLRFVHRATRMEVRTQGLDLFVDDPQQWVQGFYGAQDQSSRAPGRSGCLLALLALPWLLLHRR